MTRKWYEQETSLLEKKKGKTNINIQCSIIPFPAS